MVLVKFQRLTPLRTLILAAIFKSLHTQNMKHVRKIRSSIFFHIENTFISNECYIHGKAGLSAIF